MRTTILSFITAAAVLLAGCRGGSADRPLSLKESLEGRFHIGTALNIGQINGTDTAGIRITQQHFNSVVAENIMKSMFLQPEEGVFYFDEADRFVEFGEANGMFIVGHCLIWHSQLPDWFTVDDRGNEVSREVLLQRMRNHIHTVVGRYKGRVHGWDVVNEAILDDGAWRESAFYRILGPEFIDYAFRFAHEADPDAELYYNDYSMAFPGKREAVASLVRSLKNNGLRIDAVGMQGHMSMDFPTVEDFETSLLAFYQEGVNVMITELDLTALPSAWQNVGAEVSSSFEYQNEINPYPDGMPEAIYRAWNERMGDFFDLFLRHDNKITRVTLWGVADGDSWRNDWPVPGRTDYALLFDRAHQPKPVVYHIVEQAQK